MARAIRGRRLLILAKVRDDAQQPITLHEVRHTCASLSRCGLQGPVAIELEVAALGRDQLVVGSLLDDAAVFEHDDPAGLADRR
jgi:hypothetical protein